MASGMSSHSWVKFFKDAGIPGDLSAKYAVMFTDHRIQKDMLADIDRDILADIGIKAVGDKMAIMKHAQFVAEQAKRDASSKQLADGIKTLESRSSKSSSPAERMINHSISSRSPSGRNSPNFPTKSSPKSLRVEEKKLDPPADDPKSSIFERLGRNSPVNFSSKSSSGVFKRLGGSSTEELPYAGVLKKPPSPVVSPPKTPKKILITKKAKSTSVLDRLGAEVPQIPDSSFQQSHGSPASGFQAIKKVITIKKKPVTPPQKVVRPPTKIVLPPSKPSLIKTGVSTGKLTKRKSSVLDRLGDIVVTSTTKPAEEKVKMSDDSPAAKRKLIVLAPKKGVKVGLKRRSTGDIKKPQTASVKKPISSNTVSSTSAGLFRGGKKSSVFDRLGAK